MRQELVLAAESETAAGARERCCNCPTNHRHYHSKGWIKLPRDVMLRFLTLWPRDVQLEGTAPSCSSMQMTHPARNLVKVEVQAPIPRTQVFKLPKALNDSKRTALAHAQSIESTQTFAQCDRRSLGTHRSTESEPYIS